MNKFEYGFLFCMKLVGVACIMAACDLVVRGPDSVWGRAMIHLLTH